MTLQAKEVVEVNDYGTEVKLLAVTTLVQGGPISLNLKEGVSPGERLIEYAGRLCWDTQGKTGEVPDRIQKWIEVGHESMIEHPSATFYIRCSRVVTHELVRHRLASYSQRSQRYVKENEPRYITPPEFTNNIRMDKFSYDIGAEDRFRHAMQHAWDAYRDLLKAGFKPELARYVLPNACETQIVCTWNFRELRHIIRLRTSKRALPEMREVAGKIRGICKEIAPQVFGDL